VPWLCHGWFLDAGFDVPTGKNMYICIYIYLHININKYIYI
jgi:hypothetical protein